MIPRKSELRKRAKIAADPERSPAHMGWVRRSFVCAFYSLGDCEGPNHAHHVENGGMGKKCSDFLTAPICAKHHDRGHTKGWEEMEKEAGISLKKEAETLGRVSPHRPRIKK